MRGSCQGRQRPILQRAAREPEGKQAVLRQHLQNDEERRYPRQELHKLCRGRAIPHPRQELHKPCGERAIPHPRQELHKLHPAERRRFARGVCALCALVLLVISCLTALCACGKKQDLTDVFCAGFSAEIEGELPGLSFSGELCAAPAEYREDGTPRPFCGTFTFYAPESLSGTVLSRTADGTFTLTEGSLTVPVSAKSDFAAIFALFPTKITVQKTGVNGEGQTEVRGDGISLTFLADGTPYLSDTGEASARIVRFQAKPEARK